MNQITLAKIKHPFNNRVNAENKAGSRVLQSKPRARLLFPVTTGVMANEELRIEELNTTGQKYRTKK